LFPLWPWELVTVEAIDKVVVAWLIVEEVVADVQKAFHLSKPGEAGAAFVVVVVVVVVVGVEEVGVGACLGRR
jgi:hypothetical protein